MWLRQSPAKISLDHEWETRWLQQAVEAEFYRGGSKMLWQSWQNYLTESCKWHPPFVKPDKLWLTETHSMRPALDARYPAWRHKPKEGMMIWGQHLPWVLDVPRDSDVLCDIFKLVLWSKQLSRQSLTVSINSIFLSGQFWTKWRKHDSLRPGRGKKN